MPNRLIHSQSLYLKQHAHNPVDWFSWGEEALSKAKSENKPILVSIGYSSCHWCHVMEKESFENEEVAEIMNRHFVCIKIDREERPDLDNIYMEAVQVMGLQGGWPLNVFLMPDQKPFYGGTYFPKQNWIQILNGIAKAYVRQYEELAKSAEGFGRSLSRDITEKYGLREKTGPFNREEVKSFAEKISQDFDPSWGGLKRVPKFPMPAIWNFLLDFAILDHDEALGDHVLFTLEKIGMGGIYDHLGGGFSRYSVDGEWFAPHFEKMLYDNGQLLSLFSKAYRYSKSDLLKEKIEGTVDWLEIEMKHPENGYYSALDADSEGVEGKFYCWTYDELKALLGDEINWFSALYQIKEKGNWENGVNILFQTRPYQKVADDHGLQLTDLKNRLKSVKTTLLSTRNQRVKPGLDDKIISGWNGLVISGLCQAFLALNNSKYRELAIANGEFIWQKMVIHGTLYRNYKDNKPYTPAFLEDFSAVIEAFIGLYQVSFDKKWLLRANQLTEKSIEKFLDQEDGLFFLNDPKAEQLIANKKEVFDNVIPAGNSIMARNLHQLGLYFYSSTYLEMAEKMLKLVHPILENEPAFMSNWARFYLEKVVPTAEIAIVGKNAIKKGIDFQTTYHPNIVLAATEEAGREIPMLADKNLDKDLIFVCFDKSCKYPVEGIKAAQVQLPSLKNEG